MTNLTVKECNELIAQLAQQNNCDAEVLTTKGKSFSANYFKSNLDQFSMNETQSLGVRVINGTGEGAAYTESFAKEDVEETFKEALENAKILQKSYTPKLVTGGEYKDMSDFYNDKLDKVEIEKRLEAAKNLEEAARSTSDKIESCPSKLGQFHSEFYIYNTKGVDAAFKSNGLYGYAYPLAKNGDDLCQRFKVKIAQCYSELNTKELGKECAEKSLSGLGAQVPKTGTYNVILDPYAVESFVGLFQGNFSAKTVSEGLSLLEGKVGEKIFSDKITITDNPFVPNSMNSMPFDCEGTPAQETKLIENGVLNTYLTNSVYAEKLGVENTANASRSPKSELSIAATNICMTPGTTSFDELVKMYDETVVIVGIKGYSGYNGINGDFSLQVEGDLYKDGKKVHGLKDFVLSGNMFELFKNVDAVGNDLYLSHSGIQVPSLAVGQLSIAGAE